MLTLIGAPSGWTPEEYCSFFMAHIHPEDQAIIASYGADLMQGNAEVVYRYLHPIEGEIRVRCGGKRIRTEGRVVTLVGYHKELSDIVRLESGQWTEEKLLKRNRDLQMQKSQNYYWHLMDKASCGIIVYSLPDRNIQYMNAEALRLYGAENTEQVQQGIQEIKHKYHAPNTMQKLKKLGTSEKVVDYECTICGLNGSMTNVLAHSEVIRSMDGERCVFSTILDISENRTLRNEKSVLNALCADYTNVYLCDLQKDNLAVLNLNIRPGEQATSQNSEEWIQKVAEIENHYSARIGLYYRMFVDAEESPDFLEKMNPTYLMEYLPKHGGQLAYRYRTRESVLGVENFEVRIFHLTETDGFKVVMGFRVIDDIIFEEKQRRKILSDALVSAERANKAKTVFLNNMSHDIRTPMNAILGYTNIALKQNRDVNVQRSLKKIEQSSEHLLSLMNDVLDISRIESGNLQLNPVPVDINETINTVLGIACGFMADRDIKFEIAQRPINPPLVVTDPVRVRETLVNILSNAVKFTPDGGAVYFGSDWTQGRDKNHIVVSFQIRDTGIGMSEEFQKHMFEEFTQENVSARTHYKGTGLGMHLVKRFVEMLEGRIEVQSKQYEGTTVALEIPMEVISTVPIDQGEEVMDRGQLKGIHVLLAEDNELNAEIAIVQLQEAGLKVTHAIDGKEAVELFTENPRGTFDVILMDVMMPRMNGYEAARAIRSHKDGEEIPILALTANAFAEDLQASLEAGMNGHLSKPMRIDEVIRAIGSCYMSNAKT